MKMEKDPAFLFYPGDWLSGTMTFNRSHKGAYMDLLMAQHSNGHMSLEDIETVLGADFESMWELKLKKKFKQDDNGLYFNQKLEDVMNERAEYKQGRLNNLKGKNHHKESHVDSPHGDTMCRNGDGNEDNSEEKKKKVQEEETIKSKLSPEGYKDLVDTYHNLCPKMNKVQVISDTRRGYMNARVGEYGWSKVVETLRLAGESDFLNGKNDRAWKADFDWILRPKNFIKVMEGNFVNRETPAASGPPYRIFTYSEIMKLFDQTATGAKFWDDYTSFKINGSGKAVWIHNKDVMSYNIKIEDLQSIKI